MIPVIGGTGKYLLVRGVMATTPNSDKTYTQILTLYCFGQDGVAKACQ